MCRVNVCKLTIGAKEDTVGVFPQQTLWLQKE